MEEIAAAAGLKSKQAAKAVLARAVAKIPEARGLIRRDLTFAPADARRLRDAIRAGLRFTGRLVLAGNRVHSPVGREVPPPCKAFWREAERIGAVCPRAKRKAWRQRKTPAPA